MTRESDTKEKEALLNDAKAAFKAKQWSTAYRNASNLLVLDPGQKDALSIFEVSKQQLLSRSPEETTTSKVQTTANEMGIERRWGPVATIIEPSSSLAPDPTGALYYSIPAGHVMTSWCDPERAPWYIHGYIAQFGKGEYGGTMYTGVHLPHGSRLWGLRAYARGDVNADHDTSVHVSLREYCTATNDVRILGERLTATFQPGSSFELKELAHVGLDHLIDNRIHCYYLEVSTTGDGGWNRSWFNGAVLIYT